MQDNEKHVDIMVDLETLGTSPGSVILAIGAAVSDGRTFERNINIKSCQEAGLTIDPDTLIWWMTSASAESRAKNFTPAKKHDLTTALFDFNDFLKKFESYTLWGDGATFDISILEKAYDVAGWKFYWNKNQIGCYRTLKNLLPDVKIDKSNKDHTALADAKLQLEHLVRLKQAINPFKAIVDVCVKNASVDEIENYKTLVGTGLI